jgi:hypothetical protein
MTAPSAWRATLPVSRVSVTAAPFNLDLVGIEHVLSFICGHVGMTGFRSRASLSRVFKRISGKTAGGFSGPRCKPRQKHPAILPHDRPFWCRRNRTTRFFRRLWREFPALWPVARALAPGSRSRPIRTGSGERIRRTRHVVRPPENRLAADAQTGDQRSIARFVLALDIVKQRTARGNHRQQPAA